ncbi:hypothetical protein ASG90_02340 [Nocardioides sp. Soil797]|nr:hypothetical protein ASG90_02340 [Nocardioides sp. Soil797]
MTGVEQRALRIVRLGLIIGGLVVAIESAVATRQVAVVEGVREDTLAWLTPVGIEGLACACVAAHVYRRAIGQSSWLPLTAAAAFGALAVWINVTAVNGSAPIAYAMAASAPIGLMIIVHVYPWTSDRSPTVNDQAGDDQEASEAAVTPAPTDHDRSAIAEDDRSTIAPDSHRAVALHAVHDQGDRADRSDRMTDHPGRSGSAPEQSDDPPSGRERDVVVDRMLAANPEITGAVVGAEFDRSEVTGRRLLAKAKARQRAEHTA